MNTTPQRPQRKSRRTISNGTASSPLHVVHSIGSFPIDGSPSTSPVQHQRRTVPPSTQPQPSRRQAAFQRQHSVSCATPPRMMNGRLYAGSKFMDSPAPEKVPLPPVSWLADAKRNGTGVSPTPSAESIGSK